MKPLPLYRTRPGEPFEAMQLFADTEPDEQFGGLDANSASHARIAGWLLAHGYNDFRVFGDKAPYSLQMNTRGRPWVISPGDWIMRTPDGDFERCDWRTFPNTYEPAPGGLTRQAPDTSWIEMEQP